MSSTSSTTTKPVAMDSGMEREVRITRVFAAPRELVYKAWTDPAHLRIWWGPHGFTNPVCEADARVGGKWRIVMVGHGFEAPCGGEYIEVVANERLVFTNDAYAPDGSVMLEGHTTVTFEDAGAGKTKLTLVARAVGKVAHAPQMLAGMEIGWSQSLERLQGLVAPGEAAGWAGATAERELVISRVFDAPREVVFDAWVNPEHVGKWWGPAGFTTTTERIDIREGGEWEFVMHGPDGRNYPNHHRYEEVVAPERIVYTHGPAPKFQSTITFAEQQNGKTKVTMRMVLESEAMRKAIAPIAVPGGFEHLASLAEYLGDRHQPLAIGLPSEREIILRRVFAAPRALVFEMMTKCEHLKNWWGPRICQLVQCKVDLRPGGEWRFVQRLPDGKEQVFRGVYQEIVAPERIVSTECYDEPAIGSPEWLSTVTLEEHDGKTTLTTRLEHASIQARDGHLGSGMEWGASETFDRLADLLSPSRG